VVASKLIAALNKGEPLSGNLKFAAQAAAQAPLAFKEPTSSAANHLGFWGSILGAGEATRMLPENWEHGVLAAIGAAAAVPAARAGARAYVLGPGQAGALPRSKVPILNAPTVSGAYAAGAANLNR
jgi:hypothetical protein